MFDLSHGQCNDTYPGHEYYTDIVPDYEEMIRQAGANWSLNDSSEIDTELLEPVDVLIMLSPLSQKPQKNLTETEKRVIIDFIRKGGRLLLFVDEDHRVNLAEYGANDIVSPFGIELGTDIHGLPGNSGAVSFENEIFAGRREIPFSGARGIKGGIPASVCYEGGYLHSTFTTLENGGKLFVAADTMVGQLMGYPDGTRNISNKMQTRWWGNDSRLFMRELIDWALKD